MTFRLYLHTVNTWTQAAGKGERKVTNPHFHHPYNIVREEKTIESTLANFIILSDFHRPPSVHCTDYNTMPHMYHKGNKHSATQQQLENSIYACKILGWKIFQGNPLIYKVLRVINRTLPPTMYTRRETRERALSLSVSSTTHSFDASAPPQLSLPLLLLVSVFRVQSTTAAYSTYFHVQTNSTYIH